MLISQQFPHRLFLLDMSRDRRHTYSRECRLAPVSQLDTVATPDGIAPPPLKAHFFYSSPIPIDDPLSTTAIGGPADPKSTKGGLLRPFSLGDNNALERAWLGFASDHHRVAHSEARRNRGSGPSLSQADLEKLNTIIHQLATKHKRIHEREGQALGLEPETNPTDALPESGVAACCPELVVDALAVLGSEFCALTRKQERSLDQENVVQRVLACLQRLNSNSATQDEALVRPGSAGVAAAVHSPGGPEPHTEGTVSSRLADGAPTPPSVDTARAIPIRPPAVDDGISGKPFVRVGMDDTPQPSPPASLPKFSVSLENATHSLRTRRNEPSINASHPQSASRSRSSEPESGKEQSVDITVGVSRLHMVSLPTLQMKPIYWSPVNDVSVVMRATWFYR